MASLWELIFGRRSQLPDGFAAARCRAEEVMLALNPNALVVIEQGLVCSIEDVRDPDGRLFRLEYQATGDAQHAIAWARHTPWPLDNAPHQIGGLICIGVGGHGRDVAASPYTLSQVVPRARFWCIAVSVYFETGTFPSP